MVSASSRIAAADALASLSVKPASSSNRTNSFAQQLTGAIKGHTNPAANSALVRNNANGAAGQNSGGRQVLVAAGASEAADATPTMLGMGPVAGTPPVASKASSAGSTPAAAENPTMLGMGPVPGTAPVTSGLAGISAASTALMAASGVTATAAKVPVPAPKATTPQPVDSGPTHTEADAYWAGQPAAVQVLRGMPDDDAKEKLALSLANQGYSIDTQIMVWNWDPQMTMQVRENQGYAWVPSFGQSNIPIGPGLSMPGVPNTYSPNSPPAGSIPVSTAFAVGTIQNPLVQKDPVTT
jgi:hypothetical protein